MRPIERVLDRLEEVLPHGSGWKARCPGHPDEIPSLSIDEGDGGRTLLHCHAGCETAAIMAALELEMRDLFERQNGSPQVKGHYTYADADGRSFRSSGWSPKASGSAGPTVRAAGSGD